MTDNSQLSKGILEGCILKVIATGETYGYAIVEQLRAFGFEDISEGTVYPLLLRLEKNGWLKFEKRPSELGPMRKYYTLTELGGEALADFEENWSRMKNMVERILGRG